MNQFTASKRNRDVDMVQAIEKALAKLPAKTPPHGMFGLINSAIQSEIQLRNLRRRAYGFAAGFLGLVVSVAAFWSVLAEELAQSAFLDYLKVTWTDRDIIASNWDIVGSSLLESLPVINLIVALMLSFFAVGLAWMLVQAWGKSHPHNGSHHLVA